MKWPRFTGVLPATGWSLENRAVAQRIGGTSVHGVTPATRLWKNASGVGASPGNRHWAPMIATRLIRRRDRRCVFLDTTRTILKRSSGFHYARSARLP